MGFLLIPFVTIRLGGGVHLVERSTPIGFVAMVEDGKS